MLNAVALVGYTDGAMKINCLGVVARRGILVIGWACECGEELVVRARFCDVPYAKNSNVF